MKPLRRALTPIIMFLLVANRSFGSDVLTDEVYTNASCKVVLSEKVLQGNGYEQLELIFSVYLDANNSRNYDLSEPALVIQKSRDALMQAPNSCGTTQFKNDPKISLLNCVSIKFNNDEDLTDIRYKAVALEQGVEKDRLELECKNLQKTTVNF